MNIKPARTNKTSLEDFSSATRDCTAELGFSRFSLVFSHLNPVSPRKNVAAPAPGETTRRKDSSTRQSRSRRARSRVCLTLLTSRHGREAFPAVAETVGSPQAAGKPGHFQALVFGGELVQATDESFTFRVPNNIYQFWIESNHMAALQTAIVTAFGSPRAVKFATAPTTARRKRGGGAAEISARDLPATKQPGTRNNRAARSA